MDPFKNIDPDEIGRPELRGAARTLWESHDRVALAAAVKALMSSDDDLSLCVLFDRFSYSDTVYGDGLTTAFEGMRLPLLAKARGVLTRTFDGGQQAVRAPRREAVLASCMHMIFRTLQPDDRPLVLRCIEGELDWRVLWPSAWAAQFMRGKEEAFDRRSSVALAAVAARQDLPSFMRGLAIEALAAKASRDDLTTLTALMGRLPLPEAGYCAEALLDAGPEYEPIVRDAVRGWRFCEDYPIPLVFSRLGLPERGP